MLVLLSLMLEPEIGCGYGKVSHFGILCNVHLQGKYVVMTVWAFISSALKCFIMHLQRFTPVKGSLETVTRLSVCDYFLPQALVVTGYLQASSTSLLRSAGPMESRHHSLGELPRCACGCELARESLAVSLATER